MHCPNDFFRIYLISFCHPLHSLFKMAYMSDVLSVNPMDRVERPKPRKSERRDKPIEAYTASELQRIFSAIDTEPLKWRVLMRLLIDTGIRRGECCGLQWKDIDFSACTVTISGNLCYTPQKGVYLDTLKSGKVRTIDVAPEIIRKGLLTFTGTDRRFQYKGEKNGFTIIDDYAHHPHEIEATLKTAQNYPHKTLWCIFQPHTYTRTKAFLPQFAEALSLADKVILADIYAARETDTLGISSEDIVKLLKEKGKEAWYLPTFDEIEKFVMEHCTQGDLLITMGAGDVVNVGENLLAK